MDGHDTMIAEGGMISVEEREKIRRAYFIEKKSMRQIARELHVRPQDSAQGHRVGGAGARTA